MKTIFKDILKTTGVRGVVLYSPKGEIAFRQVSDSNLQSPQFDAIMVQFIGTLVGIQEIEIVYERQKVYVRQTDVGYLLISMDLSAPMAMIRLNCDMAMPALKAANRPKGLARFFKKN
jgi:hypothetical protein